jgi:hypothetical protein
MLIKDQLEFAGKVIAVAAPLLSALRASVAYAKDRSLEREKSDALKNIDTCVKRLARIRGNSDLVQLEALLDGYTRQVSQETEVSLKRLESIRQEEARREARKTQDPRGLRKVLSLYKPEGLSGWISQSLFYMFALTGLMMVGIGITTAGLGAGGRVDIPTTLLIVPASLIYFAIAAYFESVSFRLKLIGNAQRRGEISKVSNNDLGWVQKTLLMVGWPSWKSNLSRIFYYIFVLDAIAIPLGLVKDSELSGHNGLIGGASCLLVALVLRIDVLSRRAATQLKKTV